MEKLVGFEDPYSNCTPDSLIAKRKREEEKVKKENMDKGISNYFTKGPAVAQQKPKVIAMGLICLRIANRGSLSKRRQMMIS